MTTATTEKPDSDLRSLLARIRDDPDAGSWAEWARRLMEGDAKRKHKAVTRAKTFTSPPTPTSQRT